MTVQMEIVDQPVGQDQITVAGLARYACI
jgi:hypothetical protein